MNLRIGDAINYFVWCWKIYRQFNRLRYNKNRSQQEEMKYFTMKLAYQTLGKIARKEGPLLFSGPNIVKC